MPTVSKSSTTDDKTTDAPATTGATTVTFEEAIEAGYWGTVPDPAPNETYTVAGVITSAKAAASS
jgi:hypothetical protein